MKITITILVLFFIYCHYQYKMWQERAAHKNRQIYFQTTGKRYRTKNKK